MAKKTKELELLLSEEIDKALDEGAFSKLMAKARTKAGAVKDKLTGKKKTDTKADTTASSEPEKTSTTSKDEPSTDSKTDTDTSGAQKATDKPISLFTGDAALKQRMFSSIKSKEGKIDKKKVEALVMSIMKDLSAQLRANGIKVQESNNIYHSFFQRLDEQNEELEGAIELMKDLYKKRSKGQVISYLPSAIGPVPKGAPMHKAAFDKAPPQNKKVAQACKADPNCAKKYKMLRRANAEISKQFQRGGAEAEKAVRTGGRVKPQEGVLNVSQAIGGKLKSAGLDQKTITHLIVKQARPYFQKIFKARGIEGIKIKESLDAALPVVVEACALGLLKEEKNRYTKSLKVRIKRNKK